MESKARFRQGHFGIVCMWNPRGKYIAAALHVGHRVFVIDTETHKIAWTKEFEDSVLSIAWDPSGRCLAVGSGRGLYVFDDQGKLLWKAERSVYHAMWSHRGDRIAIVAEKSIPGLGSVYVVEIYERSGKVLCCSIIGAEPIKSLDWSYDDKYLAVAVGTSKRVYILDDHGKILKIMTSSGIVNVAWDSSGQHIAASGSWCTELFTRGGRRIWRIDIRHRNF